MAWVLHGLLAGARQPRGGTRLHSGRLPAARIRLRQPLRRGRIPGEHGRGPDGAAYQLAAAVGAAATRQAVRRAVGAEGALERADQGILRFGRQILVAALAVRLEL